MLMLAEKLLLHVLIILAPVLIYYIVSDNNRFGKSPFFIGTLQGIAASLCLLFAHHEYGLYWDLRYIPLVLAILYGGPKAGLMVLGSILATRTYLGGEALAFGYISGILAASVPFLFVGIFQKIQSKKKRIEAAVLFGLWPNLIMLSVLIVYLLSHDIYEMKLDGNIEVLIYIISFGVIQVIGVGFASMLLESAIEREKMKEEIRRAEKLNTLGELAASIAHEVRNPLTVVKGFLQLMQKQEKGQNFQYLSLVLTELGRAEAIINDYLNFAKPEFKKIEKFYLYELITDVLLLINPLAMTKGVQIDQYLEKNIIIETDKNQLKQALVNIVKNAIEATPQDGRVSVNLHLRDNQVCLTIKDTGKGMTSEQLSRIGSLFYSTKEKGTGLGTMVSIRIIETMNGKINYASKIDEGTEVTILLPVAKLDSQLEEEKQVG
ncbi:ATP-binding protein [Bacillus sp. FJAT-45066]|uniref:ATP-binding protein n=2 Tax=Bacillus TaxID=1386 RepID=UPI0020D101E5|nr:ATP-binding protein [Bacillus sp. FJAT-45066]